jgi:hypothetical protein
MGDYIGDGWTEAGDTGNLVSGWNITGATSDNTDNGVLYWGYEGTSDTITSYKSSTSEDGSGWLDGMSQVRLWDSMDTYSQGSDWDLMTLSGFDFSGVSGVVSRIDVFLRHDGYGSNNLFRVGWSDGTQTSTKETIATSDFYQYITTTLSWDTADVDLSSLIVTLEGYSEKSYGYAFVDYLAVRAVVPTTITISLYSDSAKTQLVAQGTASATGEITLIEQGSSGISGTVTATSLGTDTDSGNTLTGQSSDDSYPIFSDYNVSPETSSTYTAGQTYQFNTTITNTNGTAGIEFNETNYTMTNSSSVFNKTFNSLGAGTYSYYFWSYGNGSNNLFNMSSEFTYTINQITGLVNGTINGAQENFTARNESAINIYVNATNVTGLGTGKIYLNGSLINQGEMPLSNLTNLSIGEYNITFVYDGNQNYTSSTKVLLVNVIYDPYYPIFSNYSDNSGTLTSSGKALFNVTIENTNGTVLLQINNVNYTATNLSINNYNVSLDLSSAGTYSYEWISFGNGSLNGINFSETRSYVVNSAQNTETPSSGGGWGRKYN